MSFSLSGVWASVQSHYKKAYGAVCEVSDRAEHHHIFLLAAGITFNIILFILPTILVIMFLIGSFMDSDTLVRSIELFIRRMMPVDRSSQTMMGIIAQELHKALGSSGTIGWIGIPTLLWISSTLFSSLRTAVNGVFGIPEPGFFLKYKLKDIALIFLFTIVVFLSSISTTVLTVLLSMIKSVSDRYLPAFFFDAFYNVIGVLLSLTITIGFFLFLYYFIPHRRLPRFVFWCSTIVSSFLWEAAKYVFAWYVTNLASYGKIYGVYAVAVITAVWLYYSSLILLLSAEIAQYWHETRQQKHQAETHSLHS